MPIKVLKSETGNQLLVERIMYTRRYSLVLDKKRCVGCEICQTVCPKEAIKIIKPTKNADGKFKHSEITIDEGKCEFCGICNAICPFGALTHRINSVEVVPVLKTESFPQIIHEVEVDESKCPIDCNKCEEACPLQLIKVSAEKTSDLLDKVKVDIDKEHCPGCRLCEVKCPQNAIHVRKIILGSIKINEEKCPENCHACADVCPIPGVLYMSYDGKVHVNDFCCIYCGACRTVCPVEGALEIPRTSVYHTAVRSGAWNKALEKLASTKEMTKELRGKSIMRTRSSVRKRFVKEDAQRRLKS